MTRFAKASLLLFFFSLCGAAFIVSHHARRQTPAPLPRELFAVVNDQLAAFRAADYPGAYRYAASGVQQKFTLPQFETMVRRSYGHMAHAQRVEFGRVQVQGGSALVQVFFFARDGSVRTFVYSLTSEGSGWKIDGVDEVAPSPRRQPLAGSHA